MEIFININKKMNYFPKSSTTLAFNSAPLKSFATIFPEASNTNVEGICFILYVKAIGSSNSFKFEI